MLPKELHGKRKMGIPMYAALLVAGYAVTRMLRKRKQGASGQKREDRLDSTVAASFPASDPPPF